MAGKPPVIRAFHGDPAVRAELLARLRRHAADDTLSFGATRWDGRGGSPLGVSIQGEDCAIYAERFGYPLTLAGLLDPMTAIPGVTDPAGDAVGWVECVAPGADLSLVPWRIVEEVLARFGVDGRDGSVVGRLRDMHAAEAAGEAIGRADWAGIRAEVEAAADAAPMAARAGLKACALACWPLQRSRSVLVEVINAWRNEPARAPDPGFPPEDQARAKAMLSALWEESAPAREAGEPVHIPKLFRARDPDLARRYEADLDRRTALVLERGRIVPGLVLHHLAICGRADSGTAIAGVPAYPTPIG